MVSYIDVLRGNVEVGQRVAVIGAGGIGFDVSEYLSHDHNLPSPEPLDHWLREWGVDFDTLEPGGLVQPEVDATERTIYLLQRKTSELGKDLGKTSGWVHRAVLKKKGVHFMKGCSYDRIDDQGLHITQGGESLVLDVDTVVLCAGQESLKALYKEGNSQYHLIGGADLAAELDAKRAIRQGSELAARL